MWPIHLNLGFKVVYYYEGFYFLVSILAAAILIIHRFRKAGLDAGVFTRSLTWILLGSILGARIFHFLFWDVQAMLTSPLAFFRIWEGGLSITGGLVGGVITAFICFSRAKVDFWRYFAAASPAVLIGQAIGRVGCFLNGDAWGIPTRVPWGVSLPKFGTLLPEWKADHRVPGEAWTWCVNQGFTNPAALTTVPLHPTQIYEALGDLLLAGMLVFLGRTLAKRDGPWPIVLWFHLGGYSVLRFGLEFLHGDRDVTVWAGMTALQIGLLAFAMLSRALFIRAGSQANH
ncbi:MAG: prolipoprotein diacylglyceryl transferase [Holophagaceae bacterium]|nr:prolipoprotein diacylglyceryl transferase [Holophagaceae bacterium]